SPWRRHWRSLETRLIWGSNCWTVCSRNVRNTKDETEPCQTVRPVGWDGEPSEDGRRFPDRLQCCGLSHSRRHRHSRRDGLSGTANRAPRVGCLCDNPPWSLYPASSAAEDQRTGLGQSCPCATGFHAGTVRPCVCCWP